MKVSFCGILICATCIALLITSCSVGNKDGTVSLTETEAAQAAATTAAPETTATVKTTVSQTASPPVPLQTTTTTAAANTPASSKTAPTQSANMPQAPQTTRESTTTRATVQTTRPVKETEYPAKLYTNAACSVYKKADASSEVLKKLGVNELTEIAAANDNGFYKLKSGGYTLKKFLSPGKSVVFTTSTSQSDAVAIPKQPPANTDKTLDFYDPAKALAYAEENWDNGIGHCAEFAEVCLEAGGVYGLSNIGATTLYNQLMASGLGYAVQLTRDKDGCIRAEEYAFPGDLLFYYCPKDKRMVHVVVYNGSDASGFVKAYSHNPANDGQYMLKYFEKCPDDCGARINNVALFCFYRDPNTMKKPSSVPTVKTTVKDSGCTFEWNADFLYSDSALVVKDSLGREVYRRNMGSDRKFNLTFYSTEKYTAYVEMYIGEKITVKSAEVTFSVPKAAEKQPSGG